jgi:hypothetical protein
LLRRPPGLGLNVLERLERLSIAHDDQCAIRATVRRGEKVDALMNGSRQRRPCLPDYGRVEVVEEEVESALVDRERRQNIAAPGKRLHPDSITRREGPQAPDFLLHSLEAAGPLVLGQHRERRVEREHHVDAPRANDGPLVSPSRTRDRDADQRPGDAQPHHAPARPHQRARRDDPGNHVHGAEATQPRLALRERAPEDVNRQQRKDRREGEQVRIVERHIGDHGSGPRRAASINSANNISAAKYSGQRKSSV